jgi:voltage-gated potassium channel
MEDGEGDRRREAWERAMEWPLLGAALAFMVAYALPIIRPDLSSGVHRVADALIFGVWGLFAIDYLVRLALSERRWKFVRANLFDLALIALPLLRPFRLLRLVIVFNVLNRRAQMTFRGQALTYVIGSVVLVVGLASLTILDVERGRSHANIQTFGDALWWSITTISTVGYGDRYPTTVEGRLTATLLMLAGIALIGVITASLASWFVERLRNVQQGEERTQAALDQVLTELRILSRRLDELTPPGPATKE